METNHIPEKELDFDIVIVGGGLVGATLASALKGQDLKVALIDKSNLPSTIAGHLDARALALAETSVQCLKMLDVWAELQPGSSPILEVHVSKMRAFGVTKICAKEFNMDVLGQVVNAESLNLILNQKLLKQSNVTIYRPDEIIQLEKMENAWRIELSSGVKFKGMLLVAADGGESVIRKRLGIGAKTKVHQQSAIVVNIQLNQPHNGVAYERFTDNGTIAMLPFGLKQVKCVWVLPSTAAKKIENMSEKEFLKNIYVHFGYRLGSLVQSGKRVIYPLITAVSENVYSDRVVLIGNAANNLHPVAAQGFNLGLRDAATLAEELVLGKNTKQDIGSIDVLRTYAIKREIDYLRIHQFTNQLTEPNFLQWLGIFAAEWAPSFKRRVLERGLGRQVNLPKLCRGLELS